MHDESLSIAIKDAGEAFEPPWPDMRAVTQRGRRRWWLTRAVAVTATLALVAAAVAVVSRVGVREPRPGPAAPLRRWDPIAGAPLTGRIHTASVWTGTELIVAGGRADDTGLPVTDGAAYDPSTGRWEEIPPVPEPATGATAVWTGGELILWGGENDDKDGRSPFPGYAFEPSSRTWRALPEPPYRSLGGHSAVWSGREMIVWGGESSTRVWGAAYDPVADEWRRIPNGPLPSRHGHEAVWTGDRMVVWGGRARTGVVATDLDGAEYDPVTRRWKALPPSPIGASTAATSLWTGDEMVVTGGLGAQAASRAGAAYDPAARTWREIAGSPIPLTDMHVTPVWTGERAVFVTTEGVLSYDPRADRWARVDAPRDAWRMGATVAYTGEELLVWSGSQSNAEGYVTTGWRARD